MMKAPSITFAILLGTFAWVPFLLGQSPAELRMPDLLAPVVPQWPLMEGGEDGGVLKVKPLVEFVLPRPEISEQTRATISAALIVPETPESGMPVRPDKDAGGKSPWPHPWRLDQSPRVKVQKFRVDP